MVLDLTVKQLEIDCAISMGCVKDSKLGGGSKVMESKG